ncbi:hypothetical protein MTP04_24900 [Lysinibacillus sp. PLM2]|nr:hypothetical protein MTP04_24900 [Lysinibacillus sp. PLM2]
MKYVLKPINNIDKQQVTEKRLYKQRILIKNSKNKSSIDSWAARAATKTDRA